MPPPTEPDPPEKKYTFKAAEFTPDNASEVEPEPPGNDPLAILKANRAHEQANNSIYDQSPAVVKTKSRRNRDYVIIMILVNLLLVFLLLTFNDDVSHTYIIAGFGLFNGGFSWVMLYVVDDY
jgi:hypothetical protein